MLRGDLGELVSVEMSELAAAERESDRAEVVRSDFDVGPGADDGCDAGGCSLLVRVGCGLFRFPPAGSAFAPRS